MAGSRESLADLSQEDQAALKAQAKEFETTRWQVAKADQRRNEQRLADELGTKVIVLSKDELSVMAAKVRANVWPQVLEDIGVKWGQVILDRVSAAAK